MRRYETGRRIFAAAAAVMLLSLADTANVNAAELDTVNRQASIEIPVSVKMKSYAIVPDVSSQIILERDAANPDAPLPETTVYTFAAADTTEQKTVNFAMTYTALGEYDYKVYQQAPADTKKVTFDAASYKLKVFVYNNDQGGFSAKVVAEKSGDSTEKPDKIAFENVYVFQHNKDGGGGSGDSGGSGATGKKGITTTVATASTTPDVLGTTRNPAQQAVEAVSKAVPRVLGAARRLVKTGDSSFMAVFGMIFAIAFACLGVWIVFDENKKSKRDDRYNDGRNDRHDNRHDDRHDMRHDDGHNDIHQ